MRIISFGLRTSRIILPSIELIHCESVEEVATNIQIYKPDLIAVSESAADQIINLVTKDEFNITVVSENLTSTVIRGWIAKGAKDVISFSEWEQLLTEEKSKKGDDSAADRGSEAVVIGYNQEIPRSTFVIGVGGISEGIGTTHTSILVANYLSRALKTQVAIWEAGSKPCFQFLDYSMNGEIGLTRPRFDMKNITLFKAGVPYHQMKAVASDFRFVVLDLGNINADKERAEKFYHSDMPILVGSASEWRFRELIQFCQAQTRISQGHWRVALPLASVESTDDMIELLKGRPVFSIPLHTKPFESQEDTDECMQGILSPLIPKRKRRFWGL